MVDFKGLINKAKDFATNNPDKVREGMGKVTQVVNDKTGGKYADQVAKGAAAAESALGVPGEAKKAFAEEAAGSEPRPDAVAADPIEAPEPIAKPDKI